MAKVRHLDQAGAKELRRAFLPRVALLILGLAQLVVVLVLEDWSVRLKVILVATFIATCIGFWVYSVMYGRKPANWNSIAIVTVDIYRLLERQNIPIVRSRWVGDPLPSLLGRVHVADTELIWTAHPLSAKHGATNLRITRSALDHIELTDGKHGWQAALHFANGDRLRCTGSGESAWLEAWTNHRSPPSGTDTPEGGQA